MINHKNRKIHPLVPPVPQSPPHTQLHAFAGFGSHSQPSQSSQPSHTSQPPHTCIVLIASILNSPSPLIHYTFSVSLAQPAFLAFSLSRGVKPFFVFLIGIKDKMVTSSSVSSSGSSSSSSSWVLFQVTSLT